MERERFTKVVEDVLDSLPNEFRTCIRNVAVLVEDLPPNQSASRSGRLVMGIFHGVPMTQSLQYPDLPALAVADLYRQRWQIETFFRWIKQNLKIKAFYGTSENAVLIQIWTALIAYLLLLWLKVKSRLGWSILELTRLVQNLIMERQNLWELLRPRTTDPPDHSQLTLFILSEAC